MIVTLEETKEYLKVDYDDEDIIIISLINTAEQFIDSSIDGIIDKKQDKVKTIALSIISDLYDNRVFTGEKEQKIREIYKIMLLQL